MFETAPYVSLRTYRRNGVAVDTPVWIAPLNGDLYVFSAGEAGKVKRLRVGNQVALALCDVRGKLLGDWVDGTAELIPPEDDVREVLKAFREKYGWQMAMADWGAKLAGRFKQRSYIRISLAANTNSQDSE